MKLMALQRRFAETIVVGGSADSGVRVTFTLLGICTGVSIDPSLLQPSKQKQLEDATRDAVQSAMVLRAQEAAKHLAGGRDADEPQLK